MKRKISAFLVFLIMSVLLIGGTVFAEEEWSSTSVQVDGQPMTLTSDYDSSLVPEGYHETLLIYDGGEYWGCLDDGSESEKMFYLVSDSDPAKNGWYSLGADGITFTKYDPSYTPLPEDFGHTEPGVVSIPAMTLHIQEPPADVEVPEGYVETNLAGDSNLLKAYQQQNVSGVRADMYLVYGSIDGYNFSWYTYDLQEGTAQRFSNTDSQIAMQQANVITDLQTQLEDLSNSYNHNVGRSKNLFLITLILCVLFFFLMINSMIKRHHTKLDLEDRIIDLKRNGGKETQVFSKHDKHLNTKADVKARTRAFQYKDDEEDDYDPDYNDSKETAWFQKEGRPRWGEMQALANPDQLQEEEADAPEHEEDAEIYKRFDAVHQKGKRVKKAGQVKKGASSKKEARPASAKSDSEAADQSRHAAVNRKAPSVKKSSMASHKAAREIEEQQRVSRPMQEDDFGKTRVISPEQNMTRKSLSGTQPIIDHATRRRIKDKVEKAERNLTIAAAGNSEDFDLEALERNLGERAEEAINAPRRVERMPRFSDADVSEIKQPDAYSDVDFVDLDE